MRISLNRRANKPVVAVLALAFIAVAAVYQLTAAQNFAEVQAAQAQAMQKAGAVREDGLAAANAASEYRQADKTIPEFPPSPPERLNETSAAAEIAAATPQATKALQAPEPAAAQPAGAQASEQKGLLSNQFTYVLAAAVIAIALLLNLFKVSFAPEVAYDAAIFKTLSSDTRMELLASLQERRKTLSELAAERDISLPGAKQHLELLEEAGLIRKNDEGRKWKYYELTPQGKTILAERYS